MDFLGISRLFLNRLAYEILIVNCVSMKAVAGEFEYCQSNV